MKITRIDVYQVDLPLAEGDYMWSEGKSVATFDSTVVGVHTDAGITGWARSVHSVPFTCQRTPMAPAPASPSWRRRSSVTIQRSCSR
ncbi:hypothetical protein BH09GEM1_BH09GEM1_27020 [soil metagenome]